MTAPATSIDASSAARVDVSGRARGRTSMPNCFDRLFSPASIAIVGASATAGSISGQPLLHLMACGYRGRLYPVNPNHEAIHGVKCFPSVESLPEAPDLAVIVVAAHRVAAVVASCGTHGIPFALVISSGFAETDEAGKRAQRELVDVAGQHGIRVIGPNCQGMMNVTEDLAAGFGAPFSMRFRKGPVSVVSQSGGFGCGILVMASEEGLGFRHFVTTGNECDVSTLELIEHFCDDEGTRVIAAYIEGLTDGRRLLEVGRKALRARKPLLIWKGGTSEVGARAVASHTANMTSSAALYRAAFRQIGAIEVNDVPELADIAAGFVPGRLPRGKRVAVVTTSGGAGIVMADRYSEAGMQMPALTEETRARLKEHLPAFASLANPIDTTAGVIDRGSQLREVLSLIAADPNIDCLSLACAQLSGEVAMRIAEAVVAVYGETDKPFFLAWNAPPHLAQDAYALVDAVGVPRFRTPGRCARAMSALCSYAQSLRNEQAREPVSATASHGAKFRVSTSTRGTLAEFEAKKVLAHYGIPTTRERLAGTIEDARRLAAEVEYPLVMKIQSRDIPHKTEAGGVAMGIGDETSLHSGFETILASARRYAPNAKLDGILLQEQVTGAMEMIVGVHNDRVLGPAVLVGLGGIYSEILDDAAIRFVPVTRTEALAMIRELRAFRILDGARGRPRSDVDALADVICSVSAMAVDLGDDLVELDINPLFVFEDGRGAKAGDALLTFGREGA
jgi:acyl-CoA synthetase (NDP forming)